MPEVNGEHYSYTDKGKRAARRAKKRKMKVKHNPDSREHHESGMF